MLEIKLENYVRRALDTFEKDDHEGALKQLDKMIESLSLKSTNMRVVNLQAAVTEIKAGFLERLGREKEAEEAFSKASILEKSITSTDAMEKAYLAISAADLHAAAGNFAKAASCVFAIETGTLKQDVEGAKLMIRFAKHSFQDPRAASGKARRALVAAKDILSADKSKKNFVWFLQACDALAKIERYKNQRNAALYCNEAWEAAVAVGLARCDAETLLSVCMTGSSCDSGKASEWLDRALCPSCKMLDKGIDPKNAAKMFLKCSLAWQKENESFHPSSDCVRALKCFEILESSPESTPEELLLAQWLAGVRTASDTFSFSKREKPAKAAELLEKVLEPLKSAGPAYYMHYGLALFGLADSLTYLGEMETAFAKYKEGYRVLQKAFNKDSDTLMFYKSQMKALHLI